MELSGHSSQKVFDGYYKVLKKDLLKNNNEMFSLGIQTEPKTKKKTPTSLNISDEQVQQLQRWKELFDMGLIDEQEYKTKKKLIIG
jgi:hypothetical protein